MDFIKNIEKAKIYDLEHIVEYEEGKVASLTLAQEPNVGITLFAFDKGEGVSTHAAGGDAMVVILDGKAHIKIGDEEFDVSKGETIILPANVPHGLKASEQGFKMLLTVVKK